MAHKPEIDEFSGIETTGHEWDGLKELNKPLPRWWLWTFYACCIWSLGYWILYPAWPTLSGYTQGTLGYSQRQVVADEIAAGKAAQSKFIKAIADSELTAINADADLQRFAAAGGRAAYMNNCAACHGTGAQGFKGYPNLNDDEWIWGGSLEEIHTTLLHGIRWSENPDTRVSDMPKFGVDGLLEPAQITEVAEYVRSLASLDADATKLEAGATVFADNCAACHGDEGKGNKELGAPDLTDAIWLYGSEKADVVESIRTGRGGAMPAWSGRLDDVTIKQLAIYVHSLGGGQ